MLVDTHCHLDADEFAPDRADVVARARAAGVAMQVLPATHADEWPALREAAALDPGLHPAYGLHPTFLRHHHGSHLALLEEWIERERPVAVGECGLDFFVEDLDADAQSRFFEGQLAIARDAGLPVIVHARRAVDQVTAAIRRIGDLRGVVHSFSGSRQQAEKLWELGFMLGLGGPVTYARANRLRTLAADMPLEFLLLETDAPDQPDTGHRGQRNEPARLRVVCETIAGLRDVAPKDVAAATTANARRLFDLPG